MKPEQSYDQSCKFDGAKPRMELIPTTALTGLANVLTYGAKKYAPNSWQAVEYERYVGALMRHLVAFIDDPLGRDAESGLLHSEHLLANAAFINHYATINQKSNNTMVKEQTTRYCNTDV